MFLCNWSHSKTNKYKVLAEFEIKKNHHFLIVSNELLVFNQKAASHRGENQGLSSQTDSISGPEFSIYLLRDPRQIP